MKVNDKANLKVELIPTKKTADKTADSAPIPVTGSVRTIINEKFDLVEALPSTFSPPWATSAKAELEGSIELQNLEAPKDIAI